MLINNRIREREVKSPFSTRPVTLSIEYHTESMPTLLEEIPLDTSTICMSGNHETKGEMTDTWLAIDQLASI